MSHQNLVRHEFTAPAPAGWHLLSDSPEYSGGAAVARRPVRWAIPLPDGEWTDVQVTFRIAPESGGVLLWSDGATTIRVDLTRKAFHALHGQGAVLASGTVDRLDRELRFQFRQERWDARLGEASLFSIVPPQAALSGLMVLELHENLQLKSIEITGVKTGADTPVRPSEQFQLEVAVDFIDDLLHAPYSDRMFDDLFSELRSWGAARVQWLYYGRQDEGWWDGCPPQLRGSAHAVETFRNVGDIFTRAVRAAHDHGLELHALIKPFDMALPYSAHPDAPGVRLKRTGGGLTWIPHFVADRRDLCTVRKPGNFGPGASGPVVRIELAMPDTTLAETGVDELQLLVSDDNLSYRPYAGPIVRGESTGNYPRFVALPAGLRDSGETYRARVLRLSELEISEPYFAIATASKSASLANSVGNLVHVFTSAGREEMLTLGTVGRLGTVNITGAVPDSGLRDFRCNGVEFDFVPGKATAVLPGDKGLERTFTLDSGEGFIAIARGKDRTAAGVLSPSFREARDWWLSWARGALEAGADGVEIRVRNHHSPLTWLEYGFEEPVVTAFRERHGVDILRAENFDQRAWQELRGEGFTEFLHAASALTRERGKVFGLHLSPTTLTDPEFGPSMNIHWDWRNWLAAGLADRITLKELMPGTTPFQRIAKATVAPLPMYYSPYANGLTRPGDEVRLGQRIDLARKYGAAGFQLYECAAFIQPTRDGTLRVNQAVRAMLRARFAQKS